VHLGKFPVVQRTLFCMRCSFKRYVSAANSQAGDLVIARYVYLVTAVSTGSIVLVSAAMSQYTYGVSEAASVPP
jgi:hypothetical protein